MSGSSITAWLGNDRLILLDLKIGLTNSQKITSSLLTQHTYDGSGDGAGGTVNCLRCDRLVLCWVSLPWWMHHGTRQTHTHAAWKLAPRPLRASLSGKLVLTETSHSNCTVAGLSMSWIKISTLFEWKVIFIDRKNHHSAAKRFPFQRKHNKYMCYFFHWEEIQEETSFAGERGDTGLKHERSNPWIGLNTTSVWHRPVKVTWPMRLHTRGAKYKHRQCERNRSSSLVEQDKQD